MSGGAFTRDTVPILSLSSALHRSPLHPLQVHSKRRRSNAVSSSILLYCSGSEDSLSWQMWPPDVGKCSLPAPWSWLVYYGRWILGPNTGLRAVGCRYPKELTTSLSVSEISGGLRCHIWPCHRHLCPEACRQIQGVKYITDQKYSQINP